MKNYNTLLTLLMVVLFTTGAYAQTNTFYVCSGTSFTLVPSDTTFDNYQWNEVGGGSNPVATSKTVSLTAPTIGTSYTTVQYTLAVNDSSGCWSDADTFTIYYLPAIAVTISGYAGPYCAGSSTAVTLTATVGSLTLPTGVAADQYAWTVNNVSTGSNSNQHSFSSSSSSGSDTYAVTVTYSLPPGIGGSKLTSCAGTDNVSVVVSPAPTTPSISIQ